MNIVRFAPSPTGRIHVGNLRTALFNWFFAAKTGGQFVLRFDDTDRERSTREFADGIEADLGWIGITPKQIVRQSDRVGLYDAARDRLIAGGRLYPCYETADELDRKRARARALGKPSIYDRAALGLNENDRAKLEAEGRRPHWRFKLLGDPVHFADLIRGDQTVHTDSMSDPVLVREDGSFLYTLPSVVDDIELSISQVIRGEDHVSNTGVQIEIFEALGAAPPQFAHHNLLTGADGEGLSKRLGSLAVGQLREDGYESLAVAIMASVTGTSFAIEPVSDLSVLAARFDFSDISRGPARYAPDELDGLNARLLHDLSFEAVRRRPGLPEGLDEAAWLALRPNLARFSDIKGLWRLVTGPIQPIVGPEDSDFIATARELLPAEPWSETVWPDWTGALKQASGRKGRALFEPLRLALTGATEGPELKSLLPLIGRKGCLDRLS